MKHGCTAVSSGSAPPITESERAAIRIIADVEKMHRAGLISLSETLQVISEIVAADDARIVHEKKARR